MRLKRILGPLLAAALFSSVVYAILSPPFPRLGALLYGSSTNTNNPVLQSNIAKTRVVLFAYWPGWVTTPTETFEQAMADIKKLNLNIQLAVYGDIDTVSNNPTYAAAVDKLNTQNWWLYLSGKSGAAVPSFWTGGSGPIHESNTTSFPAPDSSRHRYMDWYAGWYVMNLVSPNPDLKSASTTYSGSPSRPETGTSTAAPTALPI
jgi:hypothetical protein